MLQTRVIVGRRTLLLGMVGAAGSLVLAACGGSTNSASTALPATAQTKPVTIAPTQVAGNTSTGKVPRAKELISKAEVEAVVGMPLKEPRETETYDGNLVSYSPIGVQVERGGNMTYDFKGFTDMFSMATALPEFGNDAFASQSDVVVLRNGILVYIGTAGVKRDGITREMLTTLMRTALGRV